MLPLYVYLRRKRIRVKHAVIVLILLMLVIQVLIQLRNKSYYHLVKREVGTSRTCVALFLVLHFRVPHEIFISESSRLDIKNKLAAYANTSEDLIFLDDKITHNGLPQSMQNQSFYMRGSANSNGKCGYVWGFDSQNREVLYDTCAEANLNNSWKFCKLPHDIMTKLSSENFANIDHYCRPNLAVAWPLGNISECLVDSSNDATRWVQYARSLDDDLMKDKVSQVIGHPMNAWQVLGLVVEYDEYLFRSGFYLISTTEASIQGTTISRVTSGTTKKSETVTPTEPGEEPSPFTASTSVVASTTMETQLTGSTLSTVRTVTNSPSQTLQHGQNVISMPSYPATTENMVSVVSTDGKIHESFTFDQEAYMEKIRRIYPEFFDQVTKTDAFTPTSTAKSDDSIFDHSNDNEGNSSGTEANVVLTPPILPLAVSASPHSLTKDESTTSTGDVMNDLFSLQQIVYKIYGVLLDNFPRPLNSLLSNIHNATEHTHVSLPKQYYENEDDIQANGSPALPQISMGYGDHDVAGPGNTVGYSQEENTASQVPSDISKVIFPSQIIGEAKFSTTTAEKDDHVHDHIEHIPSPSVTGDAKFGLYSGDGLIDLHKNIDPSTGSSTTVHSLHDDDNILTNIDNVQMTSPNPEEVDDPVLETPASFTIPLPSSDPSIEYFSSASTLVEKTDTGKTLLEISQDSRSTLKGVQFTTTPFSTQLHFDSTLKSAMKFKGDKGQDLTSAVEGARQPTAVSSSTNMKYDTSPKSTTILEAHPLTHSTSSDVIQTSSGSTDSSIDHLDSSTHFSNTAGDEDAVVILEPHKVSEVTSLEIGEYQPTPATIMSEELIGLSEHLNVITSVGSSLPLEGHSTMRQKVTTDTRETDSENSSITNVLQPAKDYFEDRSIPTMKTTYTTHVPEPVDDVQTVNVKISPSQYVEPIIIHEITLPSIDESTTSSTTAASTTAFVHDNQDFITTLSENVKYSITTHGSTIVSSWEVSDLSSELTTLKENLAIEGSTGVTSTSQLSETSKSEEAEFVLESLETTVTKDTISTDTIIAPAPQYTSTAGVVTPGVTTITMELDGMQISENSPTTINDRANEGVSKEEKDDDSGERLVTEMNMATSHAYANDKLKISTPLLTTVDARSQSTTTSDWSKATPSFISIISTEQTKGISQSNNKVDTVVTDVSSDEISTTSPSWDSQYYRATSTLKNDIHHVTFTLVEDYADEDQHQQSSTGQTTTMNNIQPTISAESEGTKTSEISSPSATLLLPTTENDTKHEVIQDKTHLNMNEIPSPTVDDVKINSSQSAFSKETISTVAGTELSANPWVTSQLSAGMTTTEMHSTILPLSSDVQSVSKQPVEETISTLADSELSTNPGATSLFTAGMTTTETHSVMLPVSSDVQSVIKQPVEGTSATESSTQSSAMTTTNEILNASARVTPTSQEIHSMLSTVSVEIKSTHASRDVLFTPTSEGPVVEQAINSTPRMDTDDSPYSSTVFHTEAEIVRQDTAQGNTLQPTQEAGATKEPDARTSTSSSFPPHLVTTAFVNQILNVHTGSTQHGEHTTMFPVPSVIKPASTGVEIPVVPTTESAIRQTSEVIDSSSKLDSQFPTSPTNYDMRSTVVPMSTDISNHGMQQVSVMQTTSYIVTTKPILSTVGPAESTSQPSGTSTVVEMISDEQHITSLPSFESKPSPVATSAFTTNPDRTVAAIDQLLTTSLHIPHADYNGNQQGTDSAPTLHHSSIQTTESSEYSDGEVYTQATNLIDSTPVKTNTESVGLEIYPTSLGTMIKINPTEKQQETKISSTQHDLTGLTDDTKTTIDSVSKVEVSSTTQYAQHSTTERAWSEPTSKSKEENNASTLPVNGATLQTAHIYSQANPIYPSTEATSSSTIYDTITTILATQYKEKTENSIATNTAAEAPVTSISSPDISSHPVSKTPHSPTSLPTFSVEPSYLTTLDSMTSQSTSIASEYDTGTSFIKDHTLRHSQESTVTLSHALLTTMRVLSEPPHGTVDTSTAKVSTENPLVSPVLVSTASIVVSSTSNDVLIETALGNPDLIPTTEIGLASSAPTYEPVTDTTVESDLQSFSTVRSTHIKFVSTPSSEGIQVETYTTKYPDTVIEVASSIIGQLFQHAMPNSLFSDSEKDSVEVNFKSAKSLHSSDGQLLTNEWLRYCPEFDSLCGLPLSRNPSDVSQTFIYEVFSLGTTQKMTLHISVYPKKYDEQQNYLITTVLDIKSDNTLSHNDIYSQYPVTFVTKLSSYLSSVYPAIDLYSINIHDFKVLPRHRKRRSTYTTVKVDWTIDHKEDARFNESMRHLILVNGTSLTNYDFFVAMLPEMIVSSSNVSIISPSSSKSNFVHERPSLHTQSGSVGLGRVLPPVLIGLFGLASCFALIVIRCRKRPTFFFVSQYMDRTYEKRKPILIDDDVEVENFRPTKVKITDENNQKISQAKPKWNTSLHRNRSLSDHCASSVSDDEEDGSYSFRDFSFVINNHVT